MSEHDAARPVYHPDVNTEKTDSSLTFLQPLGNQSAGKEYQWDGTSWELLFGYDKATYFRCSLFEVNGLLEWHALLQRIAQENVFLVMGLPTAAANLKRMTRRVRPRSFVDQNGEPATLADRAGYLLPFDFDSIPCPAHIDAIQEPDAAVRWLIETTLPAEFHKAGAVYQFSSSFGLTGNKLKAHLFFWLTDPVTMSAAKDWAKSYNRSRGHIPGNNAAKTVDDAVYQPQQPIYTKTRVCHGAADPVPSMIGLLPGGTVDFEAMRHAQKQQDEACRAEHGGREKTTCSGGSGVAYRLSRIGVDGHHAPICATAAAIVATEGRAAVAGNLAHYVVFLRAHVEQSDRLGKSEAEFQQKYCAESYLRQQFQSALDKGYGDSRPAGGFAEQQERAVSRFRHKAWLLRADFPKKKIFDLSGDL
jgi:hypothetical protein